MRRRQEIGHLALEQVPGQGLFIAGLGVKNPPLAGELIDGSLGVNKRGVLLGL